MIFARLEQITPKVTSNEPFIFCSKCHAYYFGGRPGAYCSRCGHKFRDVKEPQMITIELEEEMAHKDAVKYVIDRVDWNAQKS